jgi:hypothetical protein
MRHDIDLLLQSEKNKTKQISKVVLFTAIFTIAYYSWSFATLAVDCMYVRSFILAAYIYIS